MGHAILYCSGCSTQLREPDFDRGTALKFDGRVFCTACAPAEARAQAPPSPKPEFPSTGTGKVPKIAPPPSTTRLKSPDQAPDSNKWPLIAGGALVILGLLLALAFTGKDAPRASHQTPPPVVHQKQEVPTTPLVEKPPPPVVNDKDAEEAIRKARDHAKANPQDLTGQLALYDAAVRAASLTGHSAAVVREREAVQTKLKAVVKTRLDALDSSVKAAADREEFGPALKLLSEARTQELGTEWAAEVDQRSGVLQDNTSKLFATVRTEAVEAQKKGAEPEVKRLTERVDKWGMPAFKSDLAKAVAAAGPKKPAPPAKPLEAYRKKWTEAMGDGSFRDFPGAIKKIEEARAAPADPAVLAESAADLELLKLAISSEEEALQLVAKIPKGQKVTLTYLTESGRVEMTGTVTRNENHEIELAGEKGTVRIPLGEITARSLGQIVKEKRQDKGAAVLCLIDGDAQGAKDLVEGAAALPDKYWAFKGPPNGPTQAAARRMFYSAEMDLRSHLRVSDALQKYATLLKDHEKTEFVRRNRALIASRAEAPREFYFTLEDLRVGAGFKPFRGEKEETHWRTVNDAKGAENVVDVSFFALAETEYRCWFYVGACCAEMLSCSVQALEGDEPLGEPAPVKLPSMQYKTHEAHAGRGRPVTKWGWASVPLPKFTRAGQKKVRISAPLKGFSVAEALVSATRAGLPSATDLRELERVRVEARAVRDPSLVGHWKMADGSGPAAVDSGPFGVDAKLMNGATWTPGTASPWSPPSIRLDGTGYLTLGSNLTLLQAAPGWTMAAWICPDKIGPATAEQNTILALSRNNGTSPTTESRAALSLIYAGCLHGGGRVVDTGAALGLRTSAKVGKIGMWVHVAATVDYSSNSITLYLNGVAQAPAAGTVNFGGKKLSPNTPSTCGAIGAEDDGSGHFFTGRLSDVRVYNRALSKDEIADLAVPPR